MTNRLTPSDAVALGYAIGTLNALRGSMDAPEKFTLHGGQLKLDRALHALEAIRNGTSEAEDYTKVITR